jgi:hypothetical protein
MNRISTRISTAFAGVKCPGCGHQVVPVVPGDQGAASKPGERFSFVWRPPSGEVCPRCAFPLARYAKRVKWIRLFGLGVVTLGIATVLQVAIGPESGVAWAPLVVRALLTLGGLAILAGLGGLIVGGRRSTAGQEAPKA